ncbi:MAG: hypothetical protein ACQERD_00130 [Campylobacterota bacterium]
MEENKKEEIKELLKKSASTDHFSQYKEESKANQRSEKSFDIKKKLPNNITLIALVVTILLLLISLFYIYNQNNQIKQLNEDIKNINKQQKPKTVIKEKTVVEEKEIIKEVKVVDENLTKEKFNEFYNSRKSNKLNCYDYNIGAIKPPNKCSLNLKKFLKDNKNALRIEIIPVVSKGDKALFEGLDKIDLKNYSSESRLKKYALRGLSRDRVLELTWKIKQISGKNTILTPTNYFVESNSDSTGVIIKAYH